jgi:hypothetical protein
VKALLARFFPEPAPAREGGFFSRLFSRRDSAGKRKSMSQTTVNYGKTAKGKSALDQRSAALPPRLRPLLLLVDGYKSQDLLERLSGQIGLPVTALAELEQLGFIALGAPPSSDATEQQRPDDDDDRTVRVAPNAIDRFLNAKRYMIGALAQAGVTNVGVAKEIEAASEMSHLTQAYEIFVAVIEARRGAEAPAVIAKLRALLH